MDEQMRKAYSKAIMASLDVYDFLDEIAEECKGDNLSKLENPQRNTESMANVFISSASLTEAPRGITAMTDETAIHVERSQSNG